MARVQQLSPLKLFPYTYKGYYLTRRHGRIYGIPARLVPENVENGAKITTHPEILSAATAEDLEALIDKTNLTFQGQFPLGRYDGHTLVRHRGQVYAIPESLGLVDVNLDEERAQIGIVSGRTCDEVLQRVQTARHSVPVEFAGWLPIFSYSGNCGQHPQFAHAVHSPRGYHFTISAQALKSGRPKVVRMVRCLAHTILGVSRSTWPVTRPLLGLFRLRPGVGIRRKLSVLRAVVRLFWALMWTGVGLIATLRFIQSRHYESQILLPRNPPLVFLTSIPFTYGQHPWIIEIEDPTTLFYPFIQNGQTSDLRISESPYYRIVRTLLESDQCKAIVTHIGSTAEMLPTLFASAKIRQKTFYRPLGVELPDRWQRHEDHADDKPIQLLFINSWHQMASNFFLRGGLDILEAFSVLHTRYPRLHLTIRSNLPELDDHYHRIIEHGWVRLIRRFMPHEEMAALFGESHIFLLPAARIHIVSLLQAMSYGLAVVASDGWGIEEYITHEHNGLIVRGRYGRASWADNASGMLRENYHVMHSPEPTVVGGLVAAISRLVEDRELCVRLGTQARADVRDKYNIHQWNEGLRSVFDHAIGGARPPDRATHVAA